MKRFMKISDCLRIAGLTLFAAAVLSMSAWAVVPSSAATAAVLPNNSLYHLKASLIDQDGRTFKLQARSGRPVLISMFYNSCQFVCPMLIDTMSQTANSLTPEERSDLSMLLVTFDPARDSTTILKAVAGKHGLDPSRWTLARTDPVNVRKLAAALDIQYRLLSNGEFNHTTTVVLLDAQGSIVGRTNKIGVVDKEFVKLVQQTIHAAK